MLINLAGKNGQPAPVRFTDPAEVFLKGNAYYLPKHCIFDSFATSLINKLAKRLVPTPSNLLMILEAMRRLQGKHSTILLIDLQHRSPGKKDHCLPSDSATTFKFTALANVFEATHVLHTWQAVVFSIHFQHHSPTKQQMQNMCFAIGTCKFYSVHDARYNITKGVIAENDIMSVSTAKMSNCAFRYSETPLVISFTWITNYSPKNLDTVAYDIISIYMDESLASDGWRCRNIPIAGAFSLGQAGA